MRARTGQATKCPGSSSTASGRTREHDSSAMEQRGWNVQPDGSSIGSGIRPGMTASSSTSYDAV